MQFAKHKLRVFSHLIPRPLLLPWEAKGSYERKGFRPKHATNRFAVFCVFASLREPLARPQRAKLRGTTGLSNRKVLVPLARLLVVPHKSACRNFFCSGSKCIPRVGQVVTTLQSNPQSLSAVLILWSIHESTQSCNRAYHFVQRWAPCFGNGYAQGCIDTLPLTWFKDNLTIDIGAFTTKMADVHQSPSNDAKKR